MAFCTFPKETGIVNVHQGPPWLEEILSDDPQEPPPACFSIPDSRGPAGSVDAARSSLMVVAILKEASSTDVF